MEAYLAGYIGGASGVFLTHPLDTIKTNMQTSGRSIMQSARAIAARNGLSSFYAGVVPPVFFRGFAFAMNAFSYKKCKAQGLPPVASGFVAGALMTPFETPVMLVKTRAQVLKDKGKETIPFYIKVMWNICKKEGLSGLLSGCTIRMALNSISFGVFYLFYDPLREKYGSFYAGALAIIPSWTSVYPLEVAQSIKMSVLKKTRWSKKFYTNKWALQWATRYTVWGLWRGYSICIIRAVPRYSATLWISDELCKKFRTFNGGD